MQFAQTQTWKADDLVWWWNMSTNGRVVSRFRRDGYIVSVGPTTAVCKTMRGKIEYTVPLAALHSQSEAGDIWATL